MQHPKKMNQPTYIFLDESGNFDFSKNGTRYFVLTSITTHRPFAFKEALDNYQYNCLELGLDSQYHLDNEYFHCANDNIQVRKAIFNIIGKNLDALKIDSLIVEKQKTDPQLWSDKIFYPRILGNLLKYVLKRSIESGSKQFMIITDRIPVHKKRHAIEKAIQQALKQILPPNIRYRILHHASSSHYGLQVADYCCWAIFRKWQKDDWEYYLQIQPAIYSELDIFDIV